MTVFIVPVTFNFPFLDALNGRLFSFNCVSLLHICCRHPDCLFIQIISFCIL